MPQEKLLVLQVSMGNSQCCVNPGTIILSIDSTKIIYLERTYYRECQYDIIYNYYYTKAVCFSSWWFLLVLIFFPKHYQNLYLYVCDAVYGFPFKCNVTSGTVVKTFPNVCETDMATCNNNQFPMLNTTLRNSTVLTGH